jgi:RNA polymerase sigma-70 factor (ECF subfamily)
MISDEALFHEWQKGSAGALAELVQRHHARLLRHMLRLVGDLPLAEDLTQETFLRLVRDGCTYHYPRPFLPWLYAIARNLAANHRRSAYVRHVESRRQLPEMHDDDLDPSRWLERWERSALLRTALAQLTLEQREVLSLRFGHDLSVEETATMLGLPPGTVKSRTFTALRRLRTLLAIENRPVEGDNVAHGAG